MATPHFQRERNGEYLPRLDHLRLLAASLVILFHFFYNYIPTTSRYTGPLSGFVAQGHTGVGLFMVISGFIFGVIGYRKTIHYKNFIVNRVLRIYPLYLFAAIIGYSAVFSTVSGMDLLLLLVPFFNPNLGEIPLFGQLWTIGVEFLFYLSFPFLNQFVARYGLRYIVLFLLLLLILKFAYYLHSGTVRDIAYWTILGRMDQFLIGMLFAHVYKKYAWLGSNPLYLLLSASIVIGLVGWFNRAGGYFHTEQSSLWIFWPLLESVAWASFLICYLNCSLRMPEWANAFLSRLGTLSFSMYILHNIVISLVVKKIGILPLGASTEVNLVLTAIIIVIPAVCLVSLFTYSLIEKPFFAYRLPYGSDCSKALKNP